MVVVIRLFKSVMKVPVTTEEQEKNLKKVMRLGIKRIGPISISLENDSELLGPTPWSSKK